MFINDGYAVLIGVDDYSAFDASRKLPKGTTSLSGSINDVKVWWKQCRLLGMTPAQIRVLTSPVIDHTELEGARSENVGPATAAEIRAKVGWLAEKLGQASRPTGLLTYSGHGDWLEGKGPVVCPSDVTFVEGKGGAVDLAHALSYADLNALIGHHPAENLTVVLDCCHTGGASDGGAALAAVSTNAGRPLSLTWRPMPKDDGAHATQFAGRVLSAAGPSHLAYQSKFDGVDRGAFSWSLTSAMEQWRAVQACRGVRLDVSYGRLVETSKRLLSALWFPQVPALQGPAGLAGLAVFQHGLTAKPALTTPRPNGGRKPLEVDSGLDVWRQYWFNFTDANDTAFATLIIVNSNFTGFSTGTEYWYINLSSFNLLGSNALLCSSTDYGSSPAPVAPKYSSMQSFTMVQSPAGGWGSGWTTDPVSGGYLFSSWGLPGSYLRVTLTSGTGAASVSALTWYQVLASGTPANIVPGGHMPATSGAVSVPSGYTGYDISQSA
jgi:hypothetical protein